MSIYKKESHRRYLYDQVAAIIDVWKRLLIAIKYGKGGDKIEKLCLRLAGTYEVTINKFHSSTYNYMYDEFKNDLGYKLFSTTADAIVPIEFKPLENFEGNVFIIYELEEIGVRIQFLRLELYYPLGIKYILFSLQNTLVGATSLPDIDPGYSYDSFKRLLRVFNDFEYLIDKIVYLIKEAYVS
jgi:hypothetical protein